MTILLTGCSRYTFNGTEYQQPQPASEIIGDNWDGARFQLSELHGRAVMLFFGYTSCPDICPLTLAEATQVTRQLGAKADEMAVVFVSVDPERDTVERLANYIPAFDPGFYGIHVDEADLEPIKTAYGVFSEKRVPEEGESSLDYLVDHTGWIYIIDPDGNLRLVFPNDAGPDEIAADIDHLLQ